VRVLDVRVADCALSIRHDERLSAPVEALLGDHADARGGPRRAVELAIGSDGAVDADALAAADPIHPRPHPRDRSIWYTSRAVFRFEPRGDVRVTLVRFAERGVRDGRSVLADLHPERFYYRYVAFALSELLWSHGRLFLHAGCLARGPHRVLFAGASRSGKTTACVALLDSGWTVASDDSLFARMPDAHLFALRRPMHLDRRLGRQLPRLAAIVDAPPYLEGKSKVSFDPRPIYGAQVTGDAERPTAVFFPEIADQAESRVEPLERTAAVERLLAYALESGEPFGAAAYPHRREQVAAALLAGARAFTMTCGRDLYDEPRRIPALVAHWLAS
jgi:hypothetical protein